MLLLLELLEGDEMRIERQGDEKRVEQQCREGVKYFEYTHGNGRSR